MILYKYAIGVLAFYDTELIYNGANKIYVVREFTYYGSTLVDFMCSNN
jgi:hypothetical protein